MLMGVTPRGVLSRRWKGGQVEKVPTTPGPLFRRASGIWEQPDGGAALKAQYYQEADTYYRS